MSPTLQEHWKLWKTFVYTRLNTNKSETNILSTKDLNKTNSFLFIIVWLPYFHDFESIGRNEKLLQTETFRTAYWLSETYSSY